MCDVVSPTPKPTVCVMCYSVSFMQCSEPFDELSPGVVHVGSVVCNYSPAESSIIVPQSGCTREADMR